LSSFVINFFKFCLTESTTITVENIIYIYIYCKPANIKIKYCINHYLHFENKTENNYLFQRSIK
jgi:hypothetical protein